MALVVRLYGPLRPRQTRAPPPMTGRAIIYSPKMAFDTMFFWISVLPP